jgi:MFS family permease
MSFLLGVAMFGAVTYLPLFLQVVKGVSASSSGLLLVPFMAGVLVAAMLAGRRITKTGRYAFTGPAGFAIVVAGCGGLSTYGTETPLVVVFATMTVLGLGVGLLSPPLTIAVQNVVDPSDMGIATATTMFMRTMGAAVGVATFGALFSGNLDPDPRLRELLREPAAIGSLPETVAAGVRGAVASALHPVFMAGAVVAVVGLLLATRLREVPLRSSVPPRIGPEAEMVEAVPT